ncbi:hypothetical protein N9937_00460 [bacterium]|nr:hypothetical protein [bacterium]
MLLLPLADLPDYLQVVVLDGISYDIRLQYNPREVSWYVYLGLSGQAASVKFKATNGANLLTPFSHITGVPKGRLYLVDTVGTWGRVGRDNFGETDNRFALAYITVEELDAI